MEMLTKENKNFIGYMIIGICLVVFCGSVVFALVLKGDSYDPETFCRDEVLAHTIVVLDKTDPLSISQRKFVVNYINKAKDGLETFEKFSVFTFTEDTYMNPHSVFSKCNPGSGEDANQLYQNPRRIQIRFEEFFSKPLKENVQNILSDNTGSRSPIFEMVRELSFRDDFGNEVEKKTLIIISDLMHHTSEYSHYKNRIDYKYFSEKPYADEVSASLDSVEVKIVYLLRNNLEKIQGKRHLLFWEEYFEDMRTELVEVKNIR